ncbi:MAG: TraR/DksA family transcriptional regulator [Gemmatimonadaceae bacterium]
MTAEHTNGATSANGAANPAPRSESVGRKTLAQDRAQARLADIAAALRRLETGGYGECVACRSRIPYGRLAAMPETTHCIACAARSRAWTTHAAALGSAQPGGSR